MLLLTNLAYSSIIASFCIVWHWNWFITTKTQFLPSKESASFFYAFLYLFLTVVQIMLVAAKYAFILYFRLMMISICCKWTILLAVASPFSLIIRLLLSSNISSYSFIIKFHKYHQPTSLFFFWNSPLIRNSFKIIQKKGFLVTDFPFCNRFTAVKLSKLLELHKRLQLMSLSFFPSHAMSIVIFFLSSLLSFNFF